MKTPERLRNDRRERENRAKRIERLKEVSAMQMQTHEAHAQYLQAQINGVQIEINNQCRFNAIAASSPFFGSYHTAGYVKKQSLIRKLQELTSELSYTIDLISFLRADALRTKEPA